MRNLVSNIHYIFSVALDGLNMAFNTFLVGFWTTIWANNNGYVGGCNNEYYMNLEDYLKQQIEDYE